MVLEVSIKDEKAKLFLELLEELKNSMVEKYKIISDEEFFDEEELLKRYNEIKSNSLKPLSKEEVFDGLC